MIGQELGGRYELLARVGGGGMAIVYKAHDQLLNRNVAIKILRQQFVNDEDFIRRFRREAQSAASLSHPNVVSIYDVGQEDDTHYIVMEYVEGHNLNEIIKERAPLQVEEAVNVATQICDALDHAHHNGIIHRDIKPHNILIGRNGRVKVTDFGIARAVTSSDITQTGSVIGSVHYFSPEQAKGVSQGEKSDLYSLGIVLYQMLTNRLPFLGESPISVALKHLQEQVEEPRTANPLIPQSVENIILKALRKNPEERYQSAKEMLKDLDSALLPERRNESKIMFASPAAFTGDDEQPTRVMPAIRGGIAQEAVQTNEADEEEDPWDDVRDKPRRRWIKPVAWLVFTAALITGMFFGVRFVKDMLTIPDVVVPEVAGKPLEEADRMLQEAGLTYYIVEREYHDDVPKDEVLTQDREAGMTAKEGTAIGLVVSLGARTELMRNYVDKDVEDAVRDLKSLGVDDDRITREMVENDAAPGTVLEQQPDPDAEIIPSKVEVSFVVSEGPGTFPMPSLLGETEASARSQLVQLKLEEKIEREPSYSVQEGLVFQQHPQPGDPVAPGEEIVLYVSSGLPPDALEAAYSIELRPAQEGQTSTFEIQVTDARGELQSWGTRETAEPIIVEVPIVVTPTQSARIILYRNGGFDNSYTVTHQDVTNGNTSAEREAESASGSVDPNDGDNGGQTEQDGEPAGLDPETDGGE